MESMSLSEMTLTGAEMLLTPAFSVPLRAALTPVSYTHLTLPTIA